MGGGTSWGAWYFPWGGWHIPGLTLVLTWLMAGRGDGIYGGGGLSTGLVMPESWSALRAFFKGSEVMRLVAQKRKKTLAKESQNV